jgi:hypothetical protein
MRSAVILTPELCIGSPHYAQIRVPFHAVVGPHCEGDTHPLRALGADRRQNCECQDRSVQREREAAGIIKLITRTATVSLTHAIGQPATNA